MAPPVGTRTLVRSRDIRADLPQTPATSQTEESLLKGRYFEADCLATDAVGNMVRITGPSVLGFRQVTKVDVTDRTKMPAVGLIVSKSTITRCFVQTLGEVPLAGIVAGARYYVGAAGSPASLIPSPAPAAEAIVQVIGVGVDTGVLLLAPSFQMTVRKG